MYFGYMKNLTWKLIPTGIVIAGLAFAACQPFHYTNPPVFLIPAPNRIYEGEACNYQMQLSGKRPMTFSIKQTPLIPESPNWSVPLSINSQELVKGVAPNVDKNTSYRVEIDVLNDDGTAEQDWVFQVMDIRH